MSWFKLVKSVLRSPSKAHEKKSSRRREDCEAEEEEKKREKKRWLLGRSSKAISSHVEQTVAAETLEVQTRHALAAAEIVKLARRPSGRYLRVVRDREEHAAVIIQAAFRGYLARRAFHALRGLVKLQALVRGHNVRKQTKVVLKYMQALVRVQERLLHQQSTSLNYNHSNNISWESKHQILRERRRSRTMENRRSIRNKSIGGREVDEVFEDRAKWLDAAATPWDNCNRRASSADNHSNSNFSTTTSPIFTKRHQHYHQEHNPLCSSPFKITSYSAANTPALPRRCCMPNYMASTESAKAKARSSSPGAGVRSERGGGDGSTAKKRLSYNLAESLKSPTLPVDRDYSCYSLSQLLSPSSTTDLTCLN